MESLYCKGIWRTRIQHFYRFTAYFLYAISKDAFSMNPFRLKGFFIERFIFISTFIEVPMAEACFNGK